MTPWESGYNAAIRGDGRPPFQHGKSTWADNLREAGWLSGATVVIANRKGGALQEGLSKEKAK